jgi:hypothetical protein
MTTRHTFKAEFRAVPGSNGRQFWTLPVAYEVVDDYGSIWTRGVFDKSVTEKFPALMWGHSGWSDIAQMMGGAVDYRDTSDGPEALFELLEEDDQPNTRILAGLLKQRESGPAFVRDVSVGFSKEVWDGNGGQRSLADEDRSRSGRRGGAKERIRVADWDELSVVVAGAVPGAKTLTSVRSTHVRSKTLQFDDVIELARRKAAGDLTEAELEAAIELLATDDDPVIPDPPVEVDEIEADDGIAEAAEALEALET